MSRAANIIRGGFANWGSTPAYSSLQGSQAISPAQNQPSIALPASQGSDADQLTISPQGRDAQARLDLGNLLEQLKQKKEGELTPEQQQLIEKYKKADREVRAHEQTHLAVPGNLVVSSANLEYVTGLGDVRYVAAGGVQINTSPVSNDPQATLQKAQQIERAALASAQPSPQDHRVAAQTEAMATRASAELLQRTTAQTSNGRSVNRNIMYSRHTESSPPMWIDVFA